MTRKVKFRQPAFTHIGRTRWHKRYWLGDAPPSIHVDHNFAHWTSTGVLPNWDTSIRVTGSLLSSRTGVDSPTDHIEGTVKGIGTAEKDLTHGDASAGLSLDPCWDLLDVDSVDDLSLRILFSHPDPTSPVLPNFPHA